MIQFQFAPTKARAAIHWLVSSHPNVDLHAALKTFYFADRSHLNEHYRPIFGATYKAMRFGPVPLEMYEMAKGESIWLAELGEDRFPWQLDGFRLRLVGNTEVDLSSLSQHDIVHLKAASEKSLKLNFNQRTSATHGSDWQNANLGVMNYADMIDESPIKKELVHDLISNSRFMKL